jgi:hypothetical protein
LAISSTQESRWGFLVGATVEDMLGTPVGDWGIGLERALVDSTAAPRG